VRACEETFCSVCLLAVAVAVVVGGALALAHVADRDDPGESGGKTNRRIFHSRLFRPSWENKVDDDDGEAFVSASPLQEAGGISFQSTRLGDELCLSITFH